MQELFNDQRFTLGQEFGGWADGMHWVVRFCGSWIDCHDIDRDAALAKATEWESKRKIGLITW